jgi:hypothetical protein
MGATLDGRVDPHHAMVTVLAATWYVAYGVAHLIVTEYGIAGGLVACAVIYATSLVMDRYGM